MFCLAIKLLVILLFLLKKTLLALKLNDLYKMPITVKLDLVPVKY